MFIHLTSIIHFPFSSCSLADAFLFSQQPQVLDQLYFTFGALMTHPNPLVQHHAFEAFVLFASHRDHDKPVPDYIQSNKILNNRVRLFQNKVCGFYMPVLKCYVGIYLQRWYRQGHIFIQLSRAHVLSDNSYQGCTYSFLIFIIFYIIFYFFQFRHLELSFFFTFPWANIFCLLIHFNCFFPGVSFQTTFTLIDSFSLPVLVILLHFVLFIVIQVSVNLSQLYYSHICCGFQILVSEVKFLPLLHFSLMYIYIFQKMFTDYFGLAFETRAFSLQVHGL